MTKILEVINFCRERLDIEITPTVVERSHRIGSKKRSTNSEAKTRRIIAKFVSYRDRQVRGGGGEMSKF